MVTVLCGLRWRLCSADANASLPLLGAANVFLANGQPWPWQESRTLEPLGRWVTVSSVAKLNALPNAHVYEGESLSTADLKVSVFWAEAVPVRVSVAGALERAVSSLFPVAGSDSFTVEV